MNINRLFVLVLIMFTFFNATSQRLTLLDLTNLCNKKSWEDVNQLLLSKGWAYFDSQKGDSITYNTITWSLNKEEFNDKAQGWFQLYTIEGYPNKVIYSIFNKDAYSIIQNSISSSGYKLTSSEIEDNQLVSTYRNQSNILKVSTEKLENSDYSSSLTAYRITVIKMASVYDPDNGIKRSFYEDGESIRSEFTLKNGVIDGAFKSFYLNGNIQKAGTFINGKENGISKRYNEDGTLELECYMKDGIMEGVYKLFHKNGQIKNLGTLINGKANGIIKEYLENGDLVATYSMINGEISGILTEYENGKIYKTTNFKNGKKNGLYKEYIYNNNDSLLLENEGQYKDELKDGIWNTFLYRDRKKELVGFTTYKDEIKEGSFKDVKGDSVIFGNYANDILDGDYSVYLDLTRLIIGGIIHTDSTKLIKVSKGAYFQGKKSGDWAYYYLGKKIREGYYSNDLKEGEWKYYYANYGDNKGGILTYSGTLYAINTYKSDKLNGKCLRYSSLHEEKILCDTSINKKSNPLDTCITTTFEKLFESSYYKNDILHGPYAFKDSTGTIRFQGNYINGKRDGAWLDSYLNEGINNEKYIVFQEGNYTNDKREGKWIEYVEKDFIWAEYYYSSGKLNGNYYAYGKDKTIREFKTFEFDKLKTLSVYDSLGRVVVRKYEILTESNDHLIVRKTDYGNNLTSSYDYWMKNDNEMSNHNFFEFSFDFKTSKELNGIPSYLDGEVKIIDKSEQIIIEGNMFKESKIGLWKYNYPEQNVQIQIEYTNNVPSIEKYYVLNSNALFNGTFVFNDFSKSIKEERKIKEGIRNGKTIYIDISSDKTIKKENFKNGVLD